MAGYSLRAKQSLDRGPIPEVIWAPSACAGRPRQVNYHRLARVFPVQAQADQEVPDFIGRKIDAPCLIEISVAANFNDTAGVTVVPTGPPALPGPAGRPVPAAAHPMAPGLAA